MLEAEHVVADGHLLAMNGFPASRSIEHDAAGAS
jgi:hypothetical protein